MLLDLIRRVFDTNERKTARPTHRRRPNLGLETLEDRVVPAIRFLPGFTANTLQANDDESFNFPGAVTPVNLGFTANFFGVNYSQTFVNNNGNISFGSNFTNYTPGDLTSNLGGTAIIAPFFADVDTRGTGSGLVTFGTDTLCGRRCFGVNWVNVGYFSSNTNLLNQFQLILVDRSDTGPGNFDIEFNYDQIQWESGDIESPTGNGLGGDSAFVGYSNGSGQPGTNFTLPGSQVPGTFIDGGTNPLRNQTLLSTTPGRLHFLVRGGQVLQTFTPSGNIEVTAGTRMLAPYRYITDTSTGIQRFNYTLINTAGVTPVSTNATDACLDIIASGSVGTDVLFSPPITVVFSNLPPDVQVVNATGFTASGRPFIQINDALPRDFPVMRVQVQIRNADLDAPTTFFTPFPVRVFAGTFDPSLL